MKISLKETPPENFLTNTQRTYSSFLPNIGYPNKNDVYLSNYFHVLESNNDNLDCKLNMPYPLCYYRNQLYLYSSASVLLYYWPCGNKVRCLHARIDRRATQVFVIKPPHSISDKKAAHDSTVVKNYFFQISKCICWKNEFVVLKYLIWSLSWIRYYPPMLTWGQNLKKMWKIPKKYQKYSGREIPNVICAHL